MEEAINHIKLWVDKQDDTFAMRIIQMVRHKNYLIKKFVFT